MLDISTIDIIIHYIVILSLFIYSIKLKPRFKEAKCDYINHTSIYSNDTIFGPTIETTIYYTLHRSYDHKYKGLTLNNKIIFNDNITLLNEEYIGNYTKNTTCLYQKYHKNYVYFNDPEKRFTQIITFILIIGFSSIFAILIYIIIGNCIKNIKNPSSSGSNNYHNFGDDWD